MIQKLIPVAVVATMGLMLQPTGTKPATNDKQFAVMFMEPAAEFAARTNNRSTVYWKEWSAFISSLQSSGKMIGGSGLLPPSEGKMLGNAKTVTRADVRVSGYVIITSPDIQSVESLVQNCPALKNSGAIEIRPLLTMTPQTN